MKRCEDRLETFAKQPQLEPKGGLNIILGALILVLSVTQPNNAFGGSATWNTTPTSGDWNTATNWVPNTIPNAPTDTAAFAFSNVTNVSVSANTQVNGIAFNAGASAFTITTARNYLFSISGPGITNNSGIQQHFVVGGSDGARAEMGFYDSASAGTGTTFRVNGDLGVYAVGGRLFFTNSSSADHATFETFRGDDRENGTISFGDNATAGNGTFTNDGADFWGNSGGRIYFGSSATAGDGTFTNNSGAVSGARGGDIIFSGGDAGRGFFTNNGGTVSGAGGGTIQFVANVPGPTAADGTFINNAGTVSGAHGGGMFFSGPTAGNATLIANGGPGDGGFIRFYGFPVVGTARVKVNGNGNLDLSRFDNPPVTDTIGSIQGNGLVFLGKNTLAVGSNNLSTVFRGKMQDGGWYGGTGGSLTKTGTGKLVLSHANFYSGGTTIERGRLVVNNTSGSGTGTGPVSVKAGSLGGIGTIAGAVTAGNGNGRHALLVPGANFTVPGRLTIQSGLTFNSDATYKIQINSAAVTTDEVLANTVTINPRAQFTLEDLGNGTLPPGTVFRAISNTAATPIAGTFSNLPDGSTFTSNGNNYQVNYQGGDGNDLTLKVVP